MRSFFGALHPSSTGRLRFILLLLVMVSARAFATYTTPSAFNLSTGNYYFTTWAAGSTSGTFPANMAIHGASSGSVTDPGLTTSFDVDYSSAYNLSSGNRIVGSGSGLSCINTGTAGSASKPVIGEIVLALNTLNRHNIAVTWDIKETSSSAAWTYKMRLQYQVGSLSPTGWSDVSATTSSIEYTSAGSATTEYFAPGNLPSACENQSSTVYLRWVYYSAGSSGTRPTLALDELAVTSDASPVITIDNNLMPQYMEGNSTAKQGVPYVCHFTVSNLTASSTYRYNTVVVLPAPTAGTAVATASFVGDEETSTGGGNQIYIPSGTGSFAYASNQDFTTAADYGTFTTDASGSYSGWFAIEETAKSRFTPGNTLKIRLMINNGSNGTTQAWHATTPVSATVIGFSNSAGANNGSGIRGTSSANAMDFVMLYDNTSGTGRPLTGTFIESDGITETTNYISFYGTSVDGTAGSWGSIIPNNNANGVQMIKSFSRSLGSSLCSYTSSNGTWPTGSVNTANPTSGTTALVISSTDAGLNCPSSCSPPTSQASSANTASITSNSIALSWSRGNGNDVLVLCSAGSSITGTPVSGISYTANSDLLASSPTIIGNAQVVYNGTGTTVALTNMAPGTTYYFAVYEYNTTSTCYQTTSPSQTSATTSAGAPADVTNFTNTGSANQQVSLSWTNPAQSTGIYFDEVMIVANPSSGVTLTPSGDGTSYTGNTTYGDGTNTSGSEYVVYKGSGTSATIYALTNGITYDFKIFTRKGTNWSTGVQITGTPATPTVYYSVGSGALTGSIWSTSPTGTGSTISSFTSNINLDIQSGNTVTVPLNNINIGSITVESGGQLWVGSSTSEYFNLFGDIICNGTLGDVNAGDGLSLNIEDGNHTISGTGTINLSRIRKSDQNSASGTATLNINSNMTLSFAGASGAAIYSNRSGSTTFNVNIGSGVTVTLTGVNGSVGMDGASNNALTAYSSPSSQDRGGTITVDGTLVVPGRLYLGTNNTSIPVGLVINAGGEVQAGYVELGGSSNGSAGTNLTIYGTLKITSSSGITGETGNVFANNNSLVNTTITNSGTIEIAGTGTQNLPLTTYENLTVSNSSGLSLSGSTTVNGALDLNSGPLSIGANTLTINGGLTGSNTLTGSSSSNLSIGGSGNVTLPAFTSGSATLNNLTVNRNTSGTADVVTLGSAFTLNGTLTLTSGYLALSNYNLTMGSSSSVSGGGSSNYVRINGSGNLIRQVTTSGTFFPIGYNPYLPVTITLPGGQAAENFSVGVTNTVTDVNNSVISSDVVNKTWQITPDASAGTLNNVTVTLQWNPAEELSGFTDAAVYMAMRTASNQAWTPVNTSPQAATAGTITNALQTTSDPVTLVGGTTYLFGLGGGVSPLPVSLADFAARKSGGDVILNWNTVSETNNKGFYIEKSSNGVSWSNIGFVNGHENSQQLNAYQFTDEDAFVVPSNILYYRLRQIDNNGTAVYSKIVVVHNQTVAPFELSVSPNPVITNAVINLNSPVDNAIVSYQLVNMQGEPVSYNSIAVHKGYNKIDIDMSGMESGLYFLRIVSSYDTQTLRLMKN